MKNKTTKLADENSQNFAVQSPNYEMIKRLDDAITARGSKREFAHAAGIPLSTLNSLLWGKAEPRFSVVAAIADTLGKSMEWVRTGQDGFAPPPNPKFVAVPVLPEAVSAGAGALADCNDQDADDHFMISWDYLRSMSVNPQKAALLTVRGESMEPTLADGDMILIDRGDIDVSKDGVFVITRDGAAMVKRLMQRGQGTVMIISDNQALYPPETVTAASDDQFRVIGRVRWHARTLR